MKTRTIDGIEYTAHPATKDCRGCVFNTAAKTCALQDRGMMGDCVSPQNIIWTRTDPLFDLTIGQERPEPPQKRPTAYVPVQHSGEIASDSSGILARSGVCCGRAC